MINEFDITIGNPELKPLFLIIPLIIILHFYFIYHSKRRSLKFGNFSAMKRVETNTKHSKNFTILFFVILISTSLILAVMDINLWYKGEVSNSEYYMLLDSGASMNARDIYPDRYTVAKKITSDIVKNIETEKIGFISFSGTITKSVLSTNDKSKILNAIDASKIENTGTDMGLAIISAIQGLSFSNSTKTIILISDGHSTVGIPVNDAILKAKEEQVKIITIGIGTKEGGEFLNVPEMDGVISRIDEENLYTIAQETNSNYILLNETYNLNEVINKIVEEKKSMKIKYPLKDKLIYLAIAMIFLIFILENTRFRVFP